MMHPKQVRGCSHDWQNITTPTIQCKKCDLTVNFVGELDAWETLQDALAYAIARWKPQSWPSLPKQHNEPDLGVTCNRCGEKWEIRNTSDGRASAHHECTATGLAV